MTEIFSDSYTWIAVLLAAMSVLFVWRGLAVLAWSRYIVAAFSIWAAVVLFPVTIPFNIIQGFGVVIATLMALVLVLDIGLEIFHRVKNSIEAGNSFTKELPLYMAEVCKAMVVLASQKTGALVVVERKDDLAEHVDGGTFFDADVKAEILMALFAKTSPVHDGAIIISGGRITRVKAILPLKTGNPLPMGIGTRHRSALGISERTDAIVLVASEERGELSIGYRGRLIKPSDKGELVKLLLFAFNGKTLVASSVQKEPSLVQ